MLRTRPPRSTPERARARLACIRHAASVDPEPGSNSPPMTPKGHLTPKGRLTSKGRLTPKGLTPKRLTLARRNSQRESLPACDGHALRSGLLCCVRVQSRGSPPRFPEALPHAPLAPSSAPDAMSLRSYSRLPRKPRPQPSVPGASLSTCRPARPDSLGAADAALPLHPLHPAARSNLGGRSSQSL